MPGRGRAACSLPGAEPARRPRCPRRTRLRGFALSARCRPGRRAVGSQDPGRVTELPPLRGPSPRGSLAAAASSPAARQCRGTRSSRPCGAQRTDANHGRTRRSCVPRLPPAQPRRGSYPPPGELLWQPALLPPPSKGPEPPCPRPAQGGRGRSPEQQRGPRGAGKPRGCEAPPAQRRGRIWARGGGAAAQGVPWAPRPLTLPKPPRHSRFHFLLQPRGRFASSAGLGVPGAGGGQEEPGRRGGSVTPVLPARAFCLLIGQWENQVPTAEARAAARLRAVTHQPPALPGSRPQPPTLGTTSPPRPGAQDHESPQPRPAPLRPPHAPSPVPGLVGEGAGAGSSWARMAPGLRAPLNPPGAEQRFPQGFLRDRCAEISQPSTLGAPGLCSSFAPAGTRAVGPRCLSTRRGFPGVLGKPLLPALPSQGTGPPSRPARR